MSKPRFQTEAEMAALVVEWLHGEEWEVFQEVNAGSGLPTCDIVAKRCGVTWAIECKLCMNLDVLAQAAYWRFRANYVAVAIPHYCKYPYSAEGLLHELGIGRITISIPDDRRRSPSELVHLRDQSTFRRTRKPDVTRLLHEEQKTLCAAGGNRGGYFSPFKGTCRAIAAAAAENPGISLKELFAKITHHYSSDASARRCIPSWIESGKVAGVRLQRDGKLITLYPVDAAI